MCTLILKRYDDRLEFRSNRDERLDRPAISPFWWKDNIMFAPQDSESGGTWLGVNKHGVLTAITNRMGANGEGRTTRGRLVVEALQEPTAAKAAEHIGSRNPLDYHGFHLLIADVNETFVVWSNRETISSESRSQSQLVVVTEQSYGAGENERAKWVQAEYEKGQSLNRLLKEESKNRPFERPWVSLDNYGTRSSTAIDLNMTGIVVDWIDHQTHSSEQFVFSLDH